MNDKLQLIKIYKTIIKQVYQAMINIPRIHYSLKELIIKEVYNYLDELYLANDLSDKNDRLKKKEMVVIKFKYIVSLIGSLYQYKIISEKKYKEIVNNEELVLKLMKGWKNI